MIGKIEFLQFFIYLCFLVLITSCDVIQDKGLDVPPLPNIPNTTLGEVSDVLTAHIYLDATESMQGFVKRGSTCYTKIHPHLESAITTGSWSDTKVKFFRFGTKVERIIDRNLFLEATQPKFYTKAGIFEETKIEKVIDFETQKATVNEKANISVEGQAEHIKPEEKIGNDKEGNRLVVIVTDLFQDKTDIGLLVNKLKEKYIKHNLNIGLFGLRSHFDGEIFDMGPGTTTLTYQSDPDNPKTRRPFYLLVLGKHADIAHYFDNLIASGFTEAETVIFSQHLVSPLLTFKEESEDAIKRKNVNFDTFNRSQDRRLKQFSIAKASDSIKISTELEYTPLAHAMSFNPESLEVSVIAKYKLAEQTEKNALAQKCLEVAPTLFLEDETTSKLNRFTIDFKLTPQCLAKKKTIYLYKVTVQPKINRYEAPSWCSKWNMESKQDGSKTVNLFNFARDLTRITAQKYHPKIAHFYFYIKI